MGMDGESEDVKPKLNIRIEFEHQSCTIKVKASTQLKKVFEAAEKRFGKELGTFKFFFDGQRLSADESPADYGMEDNDTIDAHLGQIGGS